MDFAAARRRLGDDHLADDATQAVFVVLAEKAGKLVGMKRGALSAWLFHVMHFACGRVRRTEGRRVERERRTVRRCSPQASAAARQELQVDAGLLVLLEDCIAQLPVAMRELIVRRFYRRESLGEIGEGMKISTEAARKRVSRAVAEIREMMVRDGVGEIPEMFLEGLGEANGGAAGGKSDRERVQSIAKGTVAMVEQVQASAYPVMSAEFFVKDVEVNLEFFEKLGFRRRWAETPDAMGRVPRASLVGGVARIWLRRAEEAEGTRPAPGVNLFFWVEGGAEGLIAHRKRIEEEGVTVSGFFDDHTLRNFTVTTPDGYSIGFFSQYV
jgi:RNA polymerase sigma factor (sigma-70 family)